MRLLSRRIQKISTKGYEVVAIDLSLQREFISLNHQGYNVL